MRLIISQTIFRFMISLVLVANEIIYHWTTNYSRYILIKHKIAVQAPSSILQPAERKVKSYAPSVHLYYSTITISGTFVYL